MGGGPTAVTPFVRAGEDLGVLEPESMRAYLLAHPLSRGGRLWCDRLLEGVDRGERTCLRLFGEAMKWVGAQTNVYAVLVERMGARSEDDLKRLVESGKRVEGLADTPVDRMLEDAVEVVRMCLMRMPERRQAVVARLSSGAVELGGQNGLG